MAWHGCMQSVSSTSGRVWLARLKPHIHTSTYPQFAHSVVTAYREQQQDSKAFAVFANLRNGEWYLPPEAWDGRVYFKVGQSASQSVGWLVVDPVFPMCIWILPFCHSHNL